MFVLGAGRGVIRVSLLRSRVLLALGEGQSNSAP